MSHARRDFWWRLTDLISYLRALITTESCNHGCVHNQKRLRHPFALGVRYGHVSAHWQSIRQSTADRRRSLAFPPTYSWRRRHLPLFCWWMATTSYDPAAAPAMVRLLIENQLDMVTGSRASQRTGGLPARPSHRQPHADCIGVPRVRQPGQRRALGLPRIQPALRQVVSRALAAVSRPRPSSPFTRSD